MSEITTKLELPYILPSQAQKHVTHNEALQRLDAAVQLVIADSRATPPTAPAEGDCHAIAADATGAWHGQDGRLAVRQDGVWIFLLPREGWRAWFSVGGTAKVYRDNAWRDEPLPPAGSMQRLGIGATGDETNRLAVSSPATLLNHAGAGHQLKLNKAAMPDTASLLFQTAWSGRAEMGLAGSDDFAIKVSADGADWTEALVITAGGHVRMPQRPLVSAAMNEGTAAKADGSRTGFQQLHLARGGFALGAGVAGGSGNQLIVPESGIYLLCLTLLATAAGSHGAAIVLNGATTVASVGAGGTGGTAASHTAAALVMLAEGDGLSMTHSGSADVQFGRTKTGLVATIL